MIDEMRGRGIEMGSGENERKTGSRVGGSILCDTLTHNPQYILNPLLPYPYSTSTLYSIINQEVL